jgi:hypothetical protein
MVIDGHQEPVTLHATVTIEPTGILVDFAGTSRISARGINVPLAYAQAYTAFGLACSIFPRVPNNTGTLSVMRITAPENCILNALPPAPVSSRHVVGQMLPDVIFGCLAQIIPERVMAEGASALWNLPQLDLKIVPRLCSCIVDAYLKRGEPPLQFDGTVLGTLLGGELSLHTTIDFKGETGFWQLGGVAGHLISVRVEHACLVTVSLAQSARLLLECGKPLPFCLPPLRQLRYVQSLLDVRDQVGRVLDADRQADR